MKSEKQIDSEVQQEMANQIVISEVQEEMAGGQNTAAPDDGGLLINEEIISASRENPDLFDNAQGFPNESAPGADRFKISVSLYKKELTDLFEDVMKEMAIDKYLFQNK